MSMDYMDIKIKHKRSLPVESGGRGRNESVVPEAWSGRGEELLLLDALFEFIVRTLF
jgi:hypothetical protein